MGEWLRDVKKVYELAHQRPFRPRQAQEVAIDGMERAFEEFSEGDEVRPILVRLPTGYGKTLVGLSAMIHQAASGRWLTRGLVYTLPTRTLTRRLWESSTNLLKAAGRGFRREGEAQLMGPYRAVREFHGGNLDASHFAATVAVSTFDVFALAYARRSRAGFHLELPAGVIATSYVVFDEAHMLRDDYSYTHLVMGRLVRHLTSAGVPVVVMTATMPRTLEEMVFDGEEPIRLPDDQSYFGTKEEEYRGRIKSIELQDFESEGASVEYVVEFVSENLRRGDRRILLILNEVGRAILFYKRLAKELGGKAKVGLIHSRIYKQDRDRREAEAFRALGKEPEGPYVLVATQVVEAGLDVSSDLLITDCAPLDSLVQRLGRCARWPGEIGNALILRYPKVGRPYPQDLVDESWEALRDAKSDGERANNLLDPAYVMRSLDDVYQGLAIKPLSSRLEEYLAYLDGLGLTTFSANRNVMRTVMARPDAFFTLVVPAGRFEIFELSRGEDCWTVAMERVTDYSGVLEGLREGKVVALEALWAMNHSFSANRRVVKRGDEFRPFVLHQITPNGGKQAIELRLIQAFRGGDQISLYALKRAEEIPWEGIFLLNPEMYDEEAGLGVISREGEQNAD